MFLPFFRVPSHGDPKNRVRDGLLHILAMGELREMTFKRLSDLVPKICVFVDFCGYDFKKYPTPGIQLSGINE